MTTNITRVFPNTPTIHTIEYSIANITLKMVFKAVGSAWGQKTWVVFSSIVKSDVRDDVENRFTSMLLLIL